MTPGIREYACAPSSYTAPTPGAPLTSTYTNMIVDAYGMEMTCKEMIPLAQPGWFQGKGYVKVDMWAGANFAAVFRQLQIDENLRVISGRIDLVSGGLDEWVNERDGNQSETAQIQAQNQAAWQGVDFYHEMITYYAYDIDSVTFDPTTGELYLYPAGEDFRIQNENIPAILVDNPEDAVIIKDKNGDQWVIDKDGKVHEVKGGGLRAGTRDKPPMTEAQKNILRKALKALGKIYTKDTLALLKTKLDQSSDELENYLAQQRSRISPPTRTLISQGWYLGSETLSSSQGSSSLGKAFKQAEYAYNRAKVILLMVEESKQKAKLELIANNLQVNQIPLREYLSASERYKTPEAEQIQQIQKAIIQLIEKVIQEKLYATQN